MAQAYSDCAEVHLFDEVDILRAPVAGEVVLTVSDDSFGFGLGIITRNRRYNDLAPGLIWQAKNNLLLITVISSKRKTPNLVLGIGYSPKPILILRPNIDLLTLKVMLPIPVSLLGSRLACMFHAIQNLLSILMFTGVGSMGD